MERFVLSFQWKPWALWSLLRPTFDIARAPTHVHGGAAHVRGWSGLGGPQIFGHAGGPEIGVSRGKLYKRRGIPKFSMLFVFLDLFGANSGFRTTFHGKVGYFPVESWVLVSGMEFSFSLCGGLYTRRELFEVHRVVKAPEIIQVLFVRLPAAHRVT